MPNRQLAHLPIGELEKLFDEKRANGDFLVTLLGELSHRKTPRSRALKRRVMQAASVAEPKPSTAASPFLMTPDQHRRAAEDYRRGEADWTEDERVEGRKLSEAHEALAKLIERRLSKKI
jgi:hypothetical protein